MHLPSKIQKYLIGTLILLLIPCVGRAQMQFTVGSIIRGFELPQTDARGKLRTKIRGEEALVISANQIRINGLMIEIYDENEIVTTSIRSTDCTYWRMENKLTTDKDIEVRHQGMNMTAHAMEWELRDSKGSFRENVKVTLQPGVFKP
jgi:hypothetical protein